MQIQALILFTFRMVFDMDYNTKVSVIIPTYNRIHRLCKTIDSIRKQTISNIEILVCDDGSTDNTKAIISEIANNDKRVKYLDCGDNGRPAIPRNIGISKASGEWLAFCDDDDYWNPVKLEAQIYCLEKSSLKACFTNAYRVFENGEIGDAYFQITGSKVLVLKDFITVNPVICSSAVIHSSLIKDVKGFAEEEELRAYEDYALWLRVASMTDCLYIDNPLTYYLDFSQTSIRTDKKIDDNTKRKLTFSNYEKWIDSLETNLSKQIRHKYKASLWKLHKEKVLVGIIRKAYKFKGMLGRSIKKCIK